MSTTKMASSEELGLSQQDLSREEFEEVEEDEEEVEEDEVDECDGGASDRGRMLKRNGGHTHLIGDQGDFMEDPPEPNQPTSRPPKRAQRPTSLDIAASATGNLHHRKQGLVKDPTSAALLKKRLQKKRAEQHAATSTTAVDDTKILVETSPDGKRSVREMTPQQPVAQSTPERPGTPSRPLKKILHSSRIHGRDDDTGDISQEILSTHPRKLPLKKNKRPPLKRQQPIPYYDDGGDGAGECQADAVACEDEEYCEDVLRPATCIIPSLTNYSLDVPLHRPPFLDNHDVDSNHIGVGYGEFIIQILP